MILEKAHKNHLQKIIELEKQHSLFLLDQPLDWHLKTFEDPNSEYLVVTHNEDFLGYCILQGLLQGSGIIDLLRMAVKKTDKGIGQKFLQQIMNYAFTEKQASLLTLDVFTDNYQAQALYLSAGFRFEGKLRQRCKSKDLYQLSMTRREFEDAVPILQQQIYLESDRVLLRPLRGNDIPGLMQISSDPDLWGFGGADLTKPENVAPYVHQALEMRIMGTGYPFIIIDKKNAEIAGSTRYCNIQLNHKCLEIGYTWLAKKFHGTGLNSHMKFLMLDFAFEKIGCKRVELKTDARNTRSRKAMRKIGAKEEATLQKHRINFDHYLRDSVYYRILDTEWPEVKANLGGRL